MPSLRIFYMLAFGLLALIIIAVGLSGRPYIENIILNIAEHNNTSVAKSFKKSIWREPYTKYFEKLPCIAGTKCIDTTQIEKVIENFIRRSTLLDLQVLSPLGRNLFDQKDIEASEEFNLAAKGGVESLLIFDYELLGKNHNVVRTFIPIKVGGRTEAVISLVYDISPLWASPLLYQTIIISSIIGTLLLTFALMYLSTLKTEKLISAQYEERTDLITAKAEAEKENQAKSQFLANISHELRTPLNAIIGFSELIKDEVMGPLNNEQYKDYTQDIHNSGVHLLSLINDILDYSKAEAGKLTVDMSEVDVTKIMNHSIRLVAPRAAEAGVTLIGEIPKEHYIIRIDGKRLKQVLLNLFSNAVKFTPDGGTITLYAWHNLTEDKFVIEVQDTGVGIAPKDISKVMAEFGQVENELSRRYEGTGLGLPLTKKLVDLMGGELQIKSKVGEGTVVSIILPYSFEDPNENKEAEVDANAEAAPEEEKNRTPAVI